MLHDLSKPTKRARSLDAGLLSGAVVLTRPLTEENYSTKSGLKLNKLWSRVSSTGKTSAYQPNKGVSESQ